MVSKLTKFRKIRPLPPELFFVSFLSTKNKTKKKTTTKKLIVEETNNIKTCAVGDSRIQEETPKPLSTRFV